MSEKNEKLAQLDDQIKVNNSTVIKTSRKILMKNEAFSKLNFANFMNNMKLQCQVYHNGALVSNDVHQLTKNENINNIAKLSDDSEKEFSLHENVVKMTTLLSNSPD